MAARASRATVVIGRAAAALVISVVAAPGCGASGEAERADPPELIVVGEPADYVSLDVDSGGRSVDATRLLAETVPLLTARILDDPDAAAAYGLDDPAVALRFTRPDGETVEILVGDENFDGTLYYAQRRHDDRIFLVLDDQIDPLLAVLGR